LIGISLMTLSFPLFGLANQSWMMYVISIPYVLGGIAGPSIQSYISNLIPTNEQGQIQGGITSVISLTAIIGPLIMTNLFSYFSSKDTPIYLPGAPFILAGILALTALTIAARYFKRNKTN